MRETISRRVMLEAARLSETGQLAREKEFIQHGATTVYAHSIHVAETSCRIAAKLPFELNEQALLRAALLHDYFLYDWHEPGDGSHRLHGFRHARTAAINAARDYSLTDKERRIIRAHMFPLDPSHVPDSFEGWIVNIADKYCALAEIFAGVRQDNIRERYVEKEI